MCECYTKWGIWSFLHGAADESAKELLDRLTSFVTPAAGQTYLYDAVGNRTQKANNGTTTAYTYAGPGNRKSDQKTGTRSE